MLSFVRAASSRQLHFARAAAHHAAKRVPGSMRAFSGVPKTMKVRLPARRRGGAARLCAQRPRSRARRRAG